MALNAQSNWNVEMSQPLKLPIRSQNSEPKPASESMAELYRKAPAQEILLPMEIISQILSYIPNRVDTQYTFYSCALVSRLWYSASIAILYERPYLSGSNFNSFVATVCPSKNAHIRQSALAPLVRRLDMGGLVHNSSRSLTARLLGRLKGNLVEFVAPQASFAINSFPALSKCTHLRYLDLSLISASISTRLLFQTLKTLQELETLLFPRTSNSDQERIDEVYEWPPKLQGLHLAGGVDDHFLRTHLRHVPSTLSRFSIQHCSMVYGPALLETLEHLGPQLQHLTIRHPMNRMGVGALDYVLLMCSSLTAFRISADFITDALFENISVGHPLQILDLDCSGTAGTEVDITAGAVYDAVEEGRLPFLRSVRVSSRLAWNATQSGRQDIIDLVETMEDLENETPLGIEPIGVWFSTD
ncbi:putative f-box domain protein [Botrytis fragariae]|uniref:Putative f-box domain protein n=1 Tax=Botrytis fragariae TaxID=1964551 RepID=A0A8H6AIQ9_9HELO|nr:putative f-box domain protein [Botrytis fragariae]KAF5868137.1 putative f-box domain protein [Botrytis fragariae]